MIFGLSSGRDSHMQITLYQHHLPGEVRVFRYLSPPVQADDEVIVCDGWYSSGATRGYCRSYMFLRRWLHVLATFGHDLMPAEDRSHGFPFAFNCDITTPHYRVRDKLYTTDLCVDVLISASGRNCVIKDREELTAMHAASQFGDLWQEMALREVRWLEDLVSQGRLVDFLNAFAPFPTAAIPCEISETAQRRLETLGFVFHPSYPRYA
ncbi:MAG TPA: DUF402 domain-containing protein [Armatimonadota bacterium]|nr:DUF402 domain-containing protein [Armatimonadota bacterium]